MLPRSPQKVEQSAWLLPSVSVSVFSLNHPAIQVFTAEEAKVALIISLLQGIALYWAHASWERDKLHARGHKTCIKKTFSCSSPTHTDSKLPLSNPSWSSHLLERRVRFWNRAISVFTPATEPCFPLYSISLRCRSPLCLSINIKTKPGLSFMSMCLCLSWPAWGVQQSQLPKRKTYPLSISETKAKEEYTEEALHLRFIHVFIYFSSCEKFLFLVERKDEFFGPCIDYCGLKAITI